MSVIVVTSYVVRCSRCLGTKSFASRAVRRGVGHRPRVRRRQRDGPRSNGVSIRARLTPDEMAAIRENHENVEAMQALVDAIPDDRVLSWSFTSS